MSGQAARPLYGSLGYVRNSSSDGQPLVVAAWDLCVLKRPIPGAPCSDAAGAYPLLPLQEDADVDAGLAELGRDGLVSFVAVLDPLCAPSALVEAFPVRRPFKTHCLVRRPGAAFSPTRHHREEMRLAARRCAVEAGPLGPWLDDWASLYGQVAEARDWSSSHRFSTPYWTDLAASPQVTAFKAKTATGELLAMALFVREGPRVYYHLASSRDAGRRARASYGILAAALERYGDADVIDLGGAAGAGDDPADGLFAFKQGFANDSEMAWLVGAVLAPDVYDVLAKGAGEDFFPAYRSPSQTGGTRTSG